nr:integrase, catalytic region, zinc finger, CCHC-type, peptidase aspartic, catalytic [Tanacetum cinerariifolium]
CYNDNNALMLAPESDEDLKAQLQDKGIVISELKKLMEKQKGKYVDTKFEKSSVIRQPNAFKSQRPLILGKPTTFSNSFVRKDFSKSTSVTQTHVSNDFSKPVTAQILPANKKSILKNTNVLNPGMYKIHTDYTQNRTSKLAPDSRKTNKRMTFSTGVISSSSVSRPQLKSNPIEDRVLHNNSRGKKQEVIDHRRNVKLTKNKTSVTACNNNLNAKTLNVKSVSMCDKCILHDKHDMCVLKSVAKPIKRTVASESNKKPRNFTRKIYEHVSQTCSWWYLKSTPSGYIWKPKSRIEKVNPNFLGTVKFGNDQIAPILGYGDLVQGAVTIKRVYYVEGLNHNLFSVGQFCDADLEVAFRKSTCFIRDLKETIFYQGKPSESLFTPNLPQAQKDGYNFYTWTYVVPCRRNRTLVEAARTMLSAAKEKGDECIFVGYSNQSRAYRVFTKRTRVIMESIHVNFDELPQMASDHISSDPAPKCQTMALNYDSLSPAIQRQEKVTQADRTVTTSNELDLLFSPMFDELLMDLL